MNSGIISVRYARALLEYVLEKGCDAGVYASMFVLGESFRRHGSLLRIVTDPVVSQTEKLRLVTLASGGGRVHKDAADAVARFFALVLDKHREHLLPLMALMYVDLYRRHHNIGIASMVTAAEITPQVRARILELAEGYTHKSIEMETRVDESIIGGFVFTMNYKRLDASVASQLRHISQGLKPGS